MRPSGEGATICGPMRVGEHPGGDPVSTGELQALLRVEDDRWPRKTSGQAINWQKHQLCSRCLSETSDREARPLASRELNQKKASQRKVP